MEKHLKELLKLLMRFWRMNKKISVCVLTWNSEKYLKRCLDSIKNLADEIIIIDRFSSDRTLEIVTLYENVVLIQGDISFNDARKISIDIAKNTWFFCIRFR